MVDEQTDAVAEGPTYRVESFGRDCLGNVTGYRVCKGYGWNRVNAPDGVFVGDIYQPGSHQQARASAETLCARLNGTAA